MSDRRNLVTDEPQLVSELDHAAQTLNQVGRNRLRRIGVSMLAEQRAGRLGIDRIMPHGRTFTPSSDGEWALIVPMFAGPPPSLVNGVEGTPLADLLAVQTGQPDCWWRRFLAPGAILGLDRWEAALADGAAVRVHENPLAWLQADCDGVVPIDWLEMGADAGLEVAA